MKFTNWKEAALTHILQFHTLAHFLRWFQVSSHWRYTTRTNFVSRPVYTAGQPTWDMWLRVCRYLRASRPSLSIPSAPPPPPSPSVSLPPPPPPALSFLPSPCSPFTCTPHVKVLLLMHYMLGLCQVPHSYQPIVLKGQPYYNAIQYSTVQYSTVHNTMLCNAIQYITTLVDVVKWMLSLPACLSWLGLSSVSHEKRYCLP